MHLAGRRGSGVVEEEEEMRRICDTVVEVFVIPSEAMMSGGFVFGVERKVLSITVYSARADYSEKKGLSLKNDARG